MSRSNGRRSPMHSLDRIAELAQTLAPLLEDHQEWIRVVEKRRAALGR